VKTCIEQSRNIMVQTIQKFRINSDRIFIFCLIIRAPRYLLFLFHFFRITRV
jgi:hypothetical protein